MSRTRNRTIGALGALVIGGATLGACTNNEQLAFPPDSVGCVFNTRSGELIGGPRLQGDGIDVEDNQEVVFLPLSDRFWSINTDTTKRDVAASDRASGFDAERRETFGEMEVKFIIHPANACQFYVEHLRRYEPLDYNVEGDATTGWMRVLARNVDTAMVDAWQETIIDHDGLVAALGLPMNAEPDGTLPEGEEPAPLLHFFLRDNAEFRQSITDNIVGKLNGKYLCGPTTDVTDPNDCDPVLVSSMEPITMSPAYDETIARWRQVAVQRDQTELGVQEEEGAADQFDTEQANAAAEAERDRLRAEAENAAELAEIEADAAVVEAREAREAQASIAVCAAESDRRGSPISTAECIELLAVLSGQYGQGDLTVVAGSGSDTGGGADSGSVPAPTPAPPPSDNG